MAYAFDDEGFGLSLVPTETEALTVAPAAAPPRRPVPRRQLVERRTLVHREPMRRATVRERLGRGVRPPARPSKAREREHAAFLLGSMAARDGRLRGAASLAENFDQADAYYTGGELGLSLKPPKAIRNAVKSVGGFVGRAVVPAATGFLTGGPAGAAAAMLPLLAGGGGGGGEQSPAGLLSLPAVMPAGTPSATQLAASSPELAQALRQAAAADADAVTAAKAALAKPRDAAAARQASEKRSLADRLKRFAQDLYREVLHRSVQVGRAAEAASRAIEAGAEAFEHGREVVSPTPAPGWTGIVNVKPWLVGAGVGLAGIVALKAIGGSSGD